MSKQESPKLWLQSEVSLRGISLSYLKNVTKKILVELKRPAASINVLFVGDAKMKRFNQAFLKHNYSTDVISFPSEEKGKGGFLGDVLICGPMAWRQSKDNDVSFRYELCFYLCHGILHFLGYDDATPGQRDKMLAKQERILEKIGVAKN